MGIEVKTLNPVSPGYTTIHDAILDVEINKDEIPNYYKGLDSEVIHILDISNRSVHTRAIIVVNKDTGERILIEFV